MHAFFFHGLSRTEGKPASLSIGCVSALSSILFYMSILSMISFDVRISGALRIYLRVISPRPTMAARIARVLCSMCNTRAVHAGFARSLFCGRSSSTPLPRTVVPAVELCDYNVHDGDGTPVQLYRQLFEGKGTLVQRFALLEKKKQSVCKFV